MNLKFPYSNLLTFLLIFTLFLTQIGIPLVTHAEEHSLTVEPFSSDSKKVKVNGKADTLYGVYANNTYDEYRTDTAGNVEILFPNGPKGGFHLYEVQPSGSISQYKFFAPTIKGSISEPSFLGINSKNEAVFYSYRANVHVKSGDEILSGYENLTIPMTFFDYSVVKAFSSIEDAFSSTVTFDLTHPAPFRFQLDETLVDSHIFTGHTLPGITIGIFNVNHQEPFITTKADENGFFYLDVGENRMLDGFNVIFGTYAFTL